MKEIFQLRPHQEKILRYRSGKMGISAVPGSGKTWTLSYLAANLIQQGRIEPDQEILIVTLVNAAVDNFASRIASQLRAEQQFPGFGYRIRTLHGLANDIVRERPDLAGLSTQYQIIDEFEATRIIKNISQDWLKANLEFFEPFLNVEDHQRQKVLEDKYQMPLMVESIAVAFIRLAKDRQLMPDDLRKMLLETPLAMPLVEMGTQIYRDYQNALLYRGSVDFDDLIRLALRCLKSDPSLVKVLRHRWPYILEDEAQDSSLLQQEILAILAGKDGNWVRVGDPNQAIYETFTTASPQYLLEFLKQTDVQEQTLPESGRSSLSIIHLANHLITWTINNHPNPAARQALNLPHIMPTPSDDPQPNPPDCPNGIHLVERALSPQEEIHYVVNQVELFLQDHPEKTIAILSPRNHRGFKFVDELENRGLPFVDSLLRSTSATRLSTGALANILKYLCDPRSTKLLERAYRVWRRPRDEEDQEKVVFEQTAKLIHQCEHIEDYLWPIATETWLVQFQDSDQDPAIVEELIAFREVVRRWQSAVHIPIDQLILSIAQDLFLNPVELALAHKLSSLLRQLNNAHPDWRLPEFTEELANIAQNERRYLGFSEEDEAFEPDRYPGKVVVTTMHKAKGLEWDCVFLTSLNNYNFPSGESYDQFQSEKWYLRDNLNLEAETIAQLKTLIERHPFDWYQPGIASEQARQEFIRERLRLLFVGITRARRWLTCTWNIGRSFSNKNMPALAFLELINYLEKKK